MEFSILDRRVSPIAWHRPRWIFVRRLRGPGWTRPFLQRFDRQYWKEWVLRRLQGSRLGTGPERCLHPTGSSRKISQVRFQKERLPCWSTGILGRGPLRGDRSHRDRRSPKAASQLVVRRTRCPRLFCRRFRPAVAVPRGTGQRSVVSCELARSIEAPFPLSSCMTSATSCTNIPYPT